MTVDIIDIDKLRAFLREFEFVAEDLAQAVENINSWITRGDKVLIYENHDLGHRELGAKKFASYGSPAALIEASQFPEPPSRLPDTTRDINWRYMLIAIYEGTQTL